MIDIYAGILLAHALDEVYLTRLGFSGPGTIMRSSKMYFQSYDAVRGLLHCLPDPAVPAKIVLVPRGAVKMIKKAVTGEVLYDQDPRTIVLGANY